MIIILCVNRLAGPDTVNMIGNQGNQNNSHQFRDGWELMDQTGISCQTSRTNKRAGDPAAAI